MLASFAAVRTPGARPSSPAGAGYVPGACNIGPAEIARRRRTGHVGLLATVVVVAALVAVGAPPQARLIAALPAAASAAGYLQAWLKFCAAFGARGISNFGPLGRAEEVGGPGVRARDRVRAYQIGLASLGVGLAVAVAASLLPL
jgi:hypothetical protein